MAHAMLESQSIGRNILPSHRIPERRITNHSERPLYRPHYDCYNVHAIWLLFSHIAWKGDLYVGDKTCFFIGHRDVPESVRPLLDAAVERHIAEYGVTEFIVGHYGRFDYMAAGSVQRAKKRHPEVELVLLLPYYPFPYDTGGYDRTYYPEGLETVPRPFAIVRANEYMIKNSDYLICYDAGFVGKTRDFVALARRREKKGLMMVTNLASEKSC